MKPLILVVLGLALGANSGYCQSDSDVSEALPSDSPPPVSLALSSMFSPLDVPDQKTMGLLQRNFLEMAGQPERELEIALVIDGTDSMAAELAGVRQSITRMLDDLKRYREQEVRVAIVVYRDHHPRLDEVTVLLDEFTADESRIAKAVESLKPESGAPFFHELLDLGIHTAIEQLPWSPTDSLVTKWILLFGDAPPYPENLQQENFAGARRRFSNESLITRARNRNIQINCVLCTSSDGNVEPYKQVLELTREFMSQLSTQTSGIMLDLSYDTIQKALVKAGGRTNVEYAKIEPITMVDLANAARFDDRPANQALNPAKHLVRLAVMPHEPFASMAFAPQRDSVRLATAIRTQFAKLPGVRTVSPVDIRRQLRRLRADGMADQQMVRGLAARLGVDYLVWGNQIPREATVNSAAYRRQDGQAVVEVSFDGDRSQLVNVMLTRATERGDANEAIVQLANLVQAGGMQKVLQNPIARTPATAGELLTAMEALEQSLAYLAGEDESRELLKTAYESAKSATQVESDNALGWWLRSNAAFNLAAADFSAGRREEGQRWMDEVKEALSYAIRNLDRLQSEALATEIRGDQALLGRGAIDAAIDHYEALTDPLMPQESQRRGHWMLAGIYAGDWGVPESQVDAAKSRQHIIEILANWPDSPQAKQLKRWLLWDDDSDQSRHNYLPKVHSELVDSEQA